MGSKIALFVLLLAVIWTGIILVKTFYKKDQLQAEIDSLKREIDKLDKKNQEAAALINYFSSDNFLERQAKEKLNLKREGEEVVMLSRGAENIEVGAAAAKSASATSSAVSAALQMRGNSGVNNLAQWWQYFFGR